MLVELLFESIGVVLSIGLELLQSERQPVSLYSQRGDGTVRDLIVELLDQFFGLLDRFENCLTLALVAPLSTATDCAGFEGGRVGALGECPAVADRFDQLFSGKELPQHIVFDSVGSLGGREPGVSLRDDEQSAEVIGQSPGVVFPALVEFRPFRDTHLQRFVFESRDSDTASGGYVSESPPAAEACSGAEQAADEEFDQIAFAGFVAAVGECQVAARPVECVFERSAGLHFDPVDPHAHETDSVA